MKDVSSPILSDDNSQRISIGKMALLDESAVMESVLAAKQAWDNGHGEWPQMAAEDRVKILLNLIESLKKVIYHYNS